MTAYTDFHYSPTGSGVISGAQVLEQTEQGINGLGQYVQDNVSGAIDTANQALTIAQTADSNATLALNTANSFASAISAANNTANNALTTAQSAQNTANSASSLATTANNNANTALNAANTATSNVANLTSSVNALGNRMTAAENAINANAGNITTLQNNLATTNANVTAASNAASAAQATATSAQSTATLARNQAYVLRYTGTTITGGGTIAYADIDNTDNIKAGDKIIDISGAIYAIASVDTANETVTVGASPVINLFCDAENLIPAANDAYDLGSSSYQWNNLYAKNYYYNGTAWGLDKANVWSNLNTFQKGIYLAGDRQAYVCPMWSGSSSGLALLTNSKAVFVGTYTDDASDRKVIDTTKGYIQFHTGTSGTDNIAIIEPTNATNSQLGTSTNKWKTLNGVNPGALSIPDKDNKVGITSEFTDLTGGSVYYIPPADGWINITADDEIYCAVVSSTHSTIFWSQSALATSISNACVTIPVRNGLHFLAKIKSTNAITATFYPCLGNV